MDQKKIGRFLKELRKEKDITQEQLAEKIKVSGRTVSRDFRSLQRGDEREPGEGILPSGRKGTAVYGTDLRGNGLKRADV